MNGGREPVDQAHEVEVTPAEVSPPRTGLMIMGALVVMVVAAVGAYFAASGDEPTEVDVAAPEASEEEGADEVDEADEAEDADEPAAEEATEAEEPADALTEEAMITEAAYDYGFGGPSSIIHTADGFVSLGWGPEGVVVTRSTDGLNWSETPTTGLPANAGVTGFAEAGDGYVAVFEVWPEYEEELLEDDPAAYFGQPESPDRVVATSDDLTTWTATELPALETAEGEYSYMNGIAMSDDVLLMLFQVEPAYTDPVQVLFEAGRISLDDLQSICEVDGGSPDSAVVVSTCDWEAQDAMYEEFEAAMAAAESDEERAEIEAEFEQSMRFDNPDSVEVARIEPGDPLHAELIDGMFEEPTASAPVTLSGPIGGPYTASTLPVDGYPMGAVELDGTFLVMVNDWNTGTNVALSSTDGSAWVKGASLGENLNVNGIAASNGVLLASGSTWDADQETMLLWTSTDAGASWDSIELDTGLYGAYGMPVGGDAGFALWLDGSTEPIPFMGPESINVESDGYNLEIRFEDDLMTLTSPDGDIVHSIPGIVNTQPEGQEIEGVVRFEGIYDTDLTFLDPETGEDLVTFGEENFQAAYESEFDFEADYEEPPRATQLWFSADGVQWSLLESGDVDYQSESWTQLAAIGDDELLVRTETYNYIEPPADLWAFEEEGREPTEEEIAALDEWDLANNQGGSVEWRRIPIG
jgi:hypothetical protein